MKQQTYQAKWEQWSWLEAPGSEFLRAFKISKCFLPLGQLKDKKSLFYSLALVFYFFMLCFDWGLSTGTGETCGAEHGTPGPTCKTYASDLWTLSQSCFCFIVGGGAMMVLGLQLTVFSVHFQISTQRFFLAVFGRLDPAGTWMGIFSMRSIHSSPLLALSFKLTCFPVDLF